MPFISFGTGIAAHLPLVVLTQARLPRTTIRKSLPAASGMPVARIENVAPSFDAAPFSARSTCFPCMTEAELGLERRRVEIGLRLLRLLQEVLGAVALLGAAT